MAENALNLHREDEFISFIIANHRDIANIGPIVLKESRNPMHLRVLMRLFPALKANLFDDLDETLINSSIENIRLILSLLPQKSFDRLQSRRKKFPLEVQIEILNDSKAEPIMFEPLEAEQLFLKLKISDFINNNFLARLIASLPDKESHLLYPNFLAIAMLHRFDKSFLPELQKYPRTSRFMHHFK